MPNHEHPSIELRRARSTDSPSITAESSYALDSTWARASFERLLNDDGRGAVWLAHRESEAAGYVVLTLKHSMEFGGVDAFIDDLFVRPHFRRQRVASALLSALFEHCGKIQAAAVHVELGPNNSAARALYSGFGLSNQGREVLTAHINREVHAV